MRKPWEVIKAVASDSSRNAKEAEVEKEARAGNDDLFAGVRLAMDKLVTFGVKKVPAHGGPDGQGLPWKAFLKLADQLAKRELTGHAARDAIELALSVAKKDEWNYWYRRILMQDLDCGATERTFNRVANEVGRKDYVVPVFSCQLATDSAKVEDKMVGKKQIESKLDGARVLAVVYPSNTKEAQQERMLRKIKTGDAGAVKMYSRNGLILENFEKLADQITTVADTFGEPMVLDGEVMSASFQDLMTQFRRKSNVQADDSILNLFDIIPLREFLTGFGTVKQSERSKQLAAWHAKVASKLPNVQVLGYEIVDLDTEEGQDKLSEINKLALKMKYEGIMIKDVDAIYECDRTTAWLKLKPFIEFDMEITDVEEGTKKNVGKMGALVGRGTEDFEGKKVTVISNVGGGFSDKQRKEFFTPKMKGMIMEVRADAVTKNKDGSYSLRFPRFRRLRGFKPGQKI